MGFWGTFVLARPGQGSLLELPAITDRSEGLEEEFWLGEWLLGRFEGPDLAQEAPAVLAELMACTAAPALIGFVLDSDAVVVDGLSAAGAWRACLARAAMRGYCEEDGKNFRAYLSARAATKAAAAWAREAGLNPDTKGLRRVFSADRADMFAEALFADMVRAAGVAEPTS